eukprot:15347805-Ditylum_brightwellii.AAC.1
MDRSHGVHTKIMLFDYLIDLVLHKRVEILDLFGTQAAFLGMPLGILNKMDLPKPLLFCDM